MRRADEAGVFLRQQDDCDLPSPGLDLGDPGHEGLSNAVRPVNEQVLGRLSARPGIGIDDFGELLALSVPTRVESEHRLVVHQPGIEGFDWTSSHLIPLDYQLVKSVFKN